MTTLSREECARRNLCLFHQDRTAVWNPGNGEASYCEECRRRWVVCEQVEIKIDLRKVRDD
jgi:hypothetical protein